jgi:CRP/FNR family transcriptional regulator
MGNYLGLVVETVSRVLTRLQNNGVLKIQGREVEILEPQTLADLAGTHWQAP